MIDYKYKFSNYITTYLYKESMKRNWLHIILFAVITLLITSCGGKEPEIEEDLLIGKWQQVNTRVFYKYLADYTGATWDEADDVSEDEAQKFEWTLKKDNLTQVHLIVVNGEVAGKVPKQYIVTELTNTTLKYKDDATGRIDSFVKVRN